MGHCQPRRETYPRQKSDARPHAQTGLNERRVGTDRRAVPARAFPFLGGRRGIPLAQKRGTASGAGAARPALPAKAAETLAGQSETTELTSPLMNCYTPFRLPKTC